MKVRIVYEGRYSDFSTPPKRGSRYWREGDVVEFPSDYAEGIVANGLAVAFSEPDVTGDVGVVLPDAAPAEGKQKARPVNATEGAKTLAKELGIDLAEVCGSGRGGRIVMADVERLE